MTLLSPRILLCSLRRRERFRLPRGGESPSTRSDLAVGLPGRYAVCLTRLVIFSTRILFSRSISVNRSTRCAGAQFLRENFLTPAVVARRMAGMNVAKAVEEFLSEVLGGFGSVSPAADVEVDRPPVGVAELLQGRAGCLAVPRREDHAPAGAGEDSAGMRSVAGSVVHSLEGARFRLIGLRGEGRMSGSSARRGRFQLDAVVQRGIVAR